MTKAKAKSETAKPAGLESNRHTIPRAHIALIGKPKSGKTTTAASMSQFYPKELGKKWVKLEDVIWIPVDEGATVPLGLSKLEVQSIPFAALLAEHGILEGINRAFDMAFDHTTKDSVVVLDTGTVMDTMLMDYWEDHAPSTRSGSRDSFAIARLMTVHSRRLEQKLMDMGCHVIINMHGKPVSQPQQNDPMGVVLSKEAQKAAGQMPGGGAVRPGYYYNEVANLWRQNLDCIFYTKATVKGKSRTYQLICEPGSEADQHEVGSRWLAVTQPVEEPNLRAIYKRVEESYK